MFVFYHVISSDHKEKLSSFQKEPLKYLTLAGLCANEMLTTHSSHLAPHRMLMAQTVQEMNSSGLPTVPKNR